MARPFGQLERALDAITVAPRQAEARRHQALADSKLGEFEQQVHVNLDGLAGTQHASVDQPVSFELPFFWAPGQRRSNFATPHFTYGFEQLQVSAVIVTMGATVVGWTTTDQGWIVGATVRIWVAAPDVTAQEPYSAIAHLSFQGYGAPSAYDDFYGGGTPVVPQTS